MASLLNKFVDSEQWDAEDIAGRLGMVLHAAFLFAGFQPYGPQPRSGHLLKKQSRKRGGSLCLSRQYTAPDLVHREGADAAVLMLCVQEDDVALLVFLNTDVGDDTPENTYLERLDLGTMRPLLCSSLGGVEPRASRICKSLADGVCWGFLHELCRRNGLPLTGFTSLPDDVMEAVLKKLTDVKDLASVECVSSQLRLLVAERDHELWKPLFRRHMLWFPYGENYHKIIPGSSWKYKYKHVVETSWRRSHPSRMLSRRPLFELFGLVPSNETRMDGPIANKYFNSSGPIQMIRLRDLSSWPHFLGTRGKSCPLEHWLFQHQKEEEMVSMRVERSGGHRRKLAQNDCKKKWNSGSAIHSPSSPHPWKHS